MLLFVLIIHVCTTYPWSAAQNQEQLKSIVISRTVTKSYKIDVANDHKMIERLNRLDTELFKQEFTVLDTRAKLLYLRSLDIELYEGFLARFNNDENQWQTFRQNCSQEDKKHIPETLKEQYILVRDCYYQHSPMGFIQGIRSYIEEQKAEHPTQDICAWKGKYYLESCDCTNNQALSLDNEFQRRKYAMLKLAV